MALQSREMFALVQKNSVKIRTIMPMKYATESRNWKITIKLDVFLEK